MNIYIYITYIFGIGPAVGGGMSEGREERLEDGAPCDFESTTKSTLIM